MAVGLQRAKISTFRVRVARWDVTPGVDLEHARSGGLRTTRNSPR